MIFFRFTPLDNQGLGYTVHGVNEAMPIESLEEGVRFFRSALHPTDVLKFQPRFCKGEGICKKTEFC